MTRKDWNYAFVTGLVLALAAPGSGQEPSPPAWEPQSSGTDASLRGVSAVSGQVAWASGASGTILKTTDGGETWIRSGPAGVADVDFRDIEAIDANNVYAMAAGPGQQSRLYRTTDGGTSWTLERVNLDPQGFWDAIGFWDETHGILVGDPVDGRFTILITADGVTWEPVEGPKAGRQEALFAASGTCLFTRGTREAWFATGGPDGGRVFHTDDGGRTWSDERTPLRQDSESAGIYSLAFSGQTGVAVGGDYTRPAEARANIAVSNNGGDRWNTPASSPAGYRSAVAYVAAFDLWIATGPSGSDFSRDGGATWQSFGETSYNALSFSAEGTGWAVGPQGAIARFTSSP